MLIREARADEYGAIGELTYRAYAALEGLGGTRGDLGAYGDSLRDVAGRAKTATILVATDDHLLGDVTFLADYTVELADMDLPDLALNGCAGFRMLAVDPEAQGRGVGEALTNACIDRARAENARSIVLHTTDFMPAAQRLYRRLGFSRFEPMDWSIGRRNPIGVLGFRLDLE